jgi:hypothetical protein
VSWQNEEQMRFVLREGKKRQIRRMCEAVGLEVVALKRVRIGRIPLADLPVGKWRYLRLLLGLQPVTTDLYLPALPQLTRELGASMGAAQQTMAAVLLAFGLGQLVLGPAGRPRRGGGRCCWAGCALHAGQRGRRWPAASSCWWPGARCRALGMAAAVVCSARCCATCTSRRTARA